MVRIAAGNRFPVDRRLIAAGVVAGVAVGALARNGLRTIGGAREESTDDSQPTGLINWQQVRSIATGMNRADTLTGPERTKLDRYYRMLVEQCIPVVAAYTGTELPPTDERAFVFDRVDWINANVEAFQRLLAPVEQLAMSAAGSTGGPSLLLGMNRRVASAEVGVLLGYLARRVLGQYDLALIGPESTDPGKLYYVEPNIRLLERTMGMPRDDFRMWLALHETTHAFEFEAHPWVRTYFHTLLTKYLESFKDDTQLLSGGTSGLRTIVTRVRSRDADTSWIEAVMTADQRIIFNDIQSLMCMIEGYSNHVMNVVGKELLPSYAVISQRFAERQTQRTAMEQFINRLTGLSLKLEQYRLGEEFIDRVVELRGHDVAKRVWEGPSTLPTMVEIRAPEVWLARMDGRDQVAPGLDSSVMASEAER